MHVPTVQHALKAQGKHHTVGHVSDDCAQIQRPTRHRDLCSGNQPQDHGNVLRDVSKALTLHSRSRLDIVVSTTTQHPSLECETPATFTQSEVPRKEVRNTSAELVCVLMGSSSTATQVGGTVVDTQRSTRTTDATCTSERSFCKVSTHESIAVQNSAALLQLEWQVSFPTTTVHQCSSR